MSDFSMEKAAERGNPSFVWRAGQERRFEMIRAAADGRLEGVVFENGCGLGAYLSHMAETAALAVGLDVEHERVLEARAFVDAVLLGVGEHLPLPANTFDLILSHEVLEHVQDDLMSIQEMVRVLKPGGRLLLFCPNRGYPFETHGVYWRGKYRFGNKLFINYLPRNFRDRLAPHVNVYTKKDLKRLFAGLPVRVVSQKIVFGGYDNIISRFGKLGRLLRWVLQTLEKTPLSMFGLSHFWVVEKLDESRAP
ncbi:MAG: class I SAM-dependent methyltransferase [Anaerolineaceae bacterium]|nr:class I SAM-dependent methyltransferase [Anaerolineaceae bacterium]